MEKAKINNFIKENTGVIAINDDCKDFSLLYSKVFKTNFYLNVRCSKFTEQEVVLHNQTKALRPTGNMKHGISIVLDINTKPFFEKNKIFEKHLYKKIKNEVFEIINSKNIEAFLKGEI